VQMFRVTECEVEFRDNPEARSHEPWVYATWTLGAPSLRDALRIVAQTTGIPIGRSGPDYRPGLRLARSFDADRPQVCGWYMGGSRYRDRDGYKVDEEHRWMVEPVQ
jgi:hypothetical protein